MSQSDPSATGLPNDETETPPSMTPTDAKTDPAERDEEARKIDSDAGLSSVVEQGGAAIAGIGSRSDDKLFKD
ncbi:hypothetical protein [Caulobacter sp. DWR2-3-1b2]|uniref:hypothetical protein n=1 Tax=unclassified Caulobacter TaxID=2648921 RepID=UPI003CEDC953